MNHDDELRQEYANNGEIIAGVGAPKSEFIKDSTKIAAAVHVWLWRQAAEGGGIEVLVQKRAASVSVWPGFWDISAAGHVDVDESLIDACARESLEEINLSNVDPDKLYCAFMMRVFPPEQREHFCHIFLYQTKGDEDFRFNDGEVEELKWISLGKLRELVKKSDDLHARIDTNGIPAHGEKIAPRGRVYFAQLFQHLARVSTLEAQNG